MKILFFAIILIITTHIMTKEERLAAMQTNIEALDTLLAEHPDLLEDLDATTAQQLQAAREHLNKKENKEKAAKGKELKSTEKANRKTAIETSKNAPKEDIGKKTFVDEILTWTGNAMTKLAELEMDEMPILMKNFKEKLELALGAKKHDINKYLYVQLCAALPNEPTTRAEVAKAMIAQLSSYDKKNIEELFKNNKDIRKDLKDDKTLVPNVLPANTSIFDALMLAVVEDKKSDSHTINTKAIEDFKAGVILFRTKLAEVTDRVLLDSLVIKSRLGEELKEVIALNKAIDPYILKTLLSISIPSNKKLTVDDVLKSIDKQAQFLYDDNTLFKDWEKRKFEFPIAKHFVVAVEKSMTSANAKSFGEAFEKWKLKVEGIFKGTDKKWRFDKDKLLKEMSLLFVEEGQFLNTLISSMLTNTKSSIIPLSNKLMNKKSPTDFEEIWKNVFAKADTNFLKEAYKGFVENATSAEEIENFISVMDSKLPDTNMLWAALAFSRHFDEKIKVPSTGNIFALAIKLTPKDTTITDSIGINLEIPFVFKPFEIDEKGKIAYYPIADQSKIKINKNNTGRFSFSDAHAKVCSITVQKEKKIVHSTVVLSFDAKNDLQKSINTDVTEGHYSFSGGIPIVGFDGSYTEEHVTKGTEDSFGAGGEWTVSLKLGFYTEEVSPDEFKVTCFYGRFGNETDNLGESTFGFKLNKSEFENKTCIIK